RTGLHRRSGKRLTNARAAPRAPATSHRGASVTSRGRRDGQTELVRLLTTPRKSCGRPWGRPAAREPGLGTGRGGDVTGVAELLCLSRTSARRRRCGRWGRARFAERDPDVRVALRLTLHEAVAGVAPEQHVLGLVIEDVVALVGLHRQHRM